jgi:hypothetical protein
MNTVKLVSRAGLIVEMPQSEFDLMSSQLGPVRARERALSDAGRALKHRRELAAYYAQTLAEQDQELIRATARQMMRDFAIQQAARELGYGNYVDRIARGGMVPAESWARAVSRATERAGNIDDTPDDGDICAAAEQLGFLTERGADWDRRWLFPHWTITAPDGWNGQPADAATATA